MLFKIKLLILLSFVCSSYQSNYIEQVDDTDLIHLLTGEDNVITLFTKTKCPECDELEAVVDNIHKELKDTLDAIVVKAENSHLVGIYDPSREPSLIYFRKGIPLLYYGAVNEEEIIRTFSDNREPIVKELSDENFEHLTQAATGATTGDWFVFFYSADCVLCQRLYAVWEAVGAKLKHRLNVARVNRLEAGISTAKRFGVTESPEFIFLRLGKMYRYRLKDYTPKSFIEFVENGYRKQLHPEDVPGAPSAMDDLFASQLRALIKYPKIVLLVISLLMLAVLTVFTLQFRARQKKAKKSEKKSKKSK